MLSQAELERHLWSAANILRGTVDAADPDEHHFHITQEHLWEAVRQKTTQIGQRLNNALAAIEDASQRLRGVFGDVGFANQGHFSDALLEKLLAHFEKHRLRTTDVLADMLGDAYHYLIKMFAHLKRLGYVR